ncbi:MAG: sigma-70 family RNA polymerase sigma factor, partial [Muribaculaceae bacterium]|nr:sigma-70 family RNA polymerase sigma factor [Muribaculaceae bacterium]
KFELENMRAPSVEELAKELDVAPEKIAETMKVSGRQVSVDAPFQEGEDNSLLDVLTNSDSPATDEGLSRESLTTEVERALMQLHERERQILKLFFGIGCQEMTLEEIGVKFDLTRERVRQIKEKAIRRLKGSKSELLKSYLAQ